MNAVILNLFISPDEYQRLYQGAVREVVATSVDGRRIRFPAMILRPWVTHNGIRGRFRIVFDENNRFQKVEKIDGGR